MTIPQSAALLPAASSAQTLNQDCYCRTLGGGFAPVLVVPR